MKSLGKVPTNVTGWPKFRRHVFETVGCAFGTPQMGTDMLLAAEAHKGPVHKIKVHSSWEKISAHLAVHLTDAMQDVDMIREATTLHDQFLKKYRRQLPGLCYWIMISRHFERDESVAKHYAMEELRH